ncbi:hypothetical protein [Streptomyces sp. NPDC049555]|uniref:hypothetical protein n=1 Tax=Streptomyces sp. NPDC049555 TaxID=3154930 RepID=UPI00344528D8
MPDAQVSPSHVLLRDDAARWATAPPERTVLAVIHNVTSATRLLDLLAPFEGDSRVQVLFTCTGSSAFDAGIREFVAARHLPYVPWEEAKRHKFDLAVSSSRGGELHAIDAPLIGAPHGAGYNKYLHRTPDTGHRTPDTGHRTPEAFGLDAEWLTHDGELIPSAVVLSHDEQRERLRRGCPQAVPASVVAGDPCMDTLRAGLPFRDEYRAALGLLPRQKLLVLTSTWGRHSLLGADVGLVRRALAELPQDEYRVLAAVHPNVWYGHGGWQVRAWLAPCLRAGLLLPAPESDVWKAALPAADAFIGDHGSLTLYAAALGIPGLLGAFGHDVVADGSPMELLGAALSHVDAHEPLERQLRRAVAARAGDERLARIGDLVTSRPMRAAALLRRLYYTRLRLDEPADPAVPRPVPLPLPLPTERRGPGTPPVLVDRRAPVAGGGALSLRRYPADLQGARDGHLTDPHVVAAEGEPDARWAHSADVLLARPPAPGETHRTAAARLLRQYPGCSLVAFTDGEAGCTTHARSGQRTTATWEAPHNPVYTPAVAASALFVAATPSNLPADGLLVDVADGIPPARLAVRQH